MRNLTQQELQELLTNSSKSIYLSDELSNEMKATAFFEMDGTFITGSLIKMKDLIGDGNEKQLIYAHKGIRSLTVDTIKGEKSPF